MEEEHLIQMVKQQAGLTTVEGDVRRLEESVEALSKDIRDGILKMTETVSTLSERVALLNQSGTGERQRLIELERRVAALENAQWRAVGGITLIVLIITTFGSNIAHFLFGG